MTQGDYFSTTIGPYDMWAIEYGYKPLSGGTEGEVAELKKIAARGAEPTLAYATDEDTRGIDPDPLSNRFDMGKDPIAFAKNAGPADRRAVAEGDRRDDQGRRGLSEGRGRCSACCLSNHGRAMYFASRYRRRRVRQPRPQGRRQRARPRSWWSSRPSSARRWPCWKSRSSATSRSSSRPSCTTTWPRRAGPLGHRDSAAHRLPGARGDRACGRTASCSSCCRR